jgi:hypothetical protein
MARKLDDEQQADLSAFVNRLAESAGYKTTAEWSRDSGYPAPNLSNLRNGVGAVDGYNLLRLIRAAAVKAERDPLSLAVEQVEDARTIADRLAEVEQGLTDLTSLIREGIQARGARGSAASPPGTSQEDLAG